MKNFTHRSPKVREYHIRRQKISRRFPEKLGTLGNNGSKLIALGVPPQKGVKLVHLRYLKPNYYDVLG